MTDDCRLYLLTPPDPGPDFGDRLAAALDAGSVACVQLRMSSGDDAAWQAAIERLRPICQDRGVAFVLDERADLVVATGCDGVHTSGDDRAVPAARRRVGAERIVGAGAGASRHDGLVKAEAGADYISFGPCGPSARTVGPPIEAELVRWWACFMTVPCVCVGGLSVDTAAEWVATGAEFLAVSSGVWEHPDGPAEAVKAFERIIADTPVPAYGESPLDGAA